jgi:hypothetical protein
MTASSWAVASPAQRWPTTSTRPTASTSSYANQAIAWGGTSVPPWADDDPPPQRASSEYGRPESYQTGLTALPDAIMDELGPARVQLRWKLINVDGRRDDDDDDGVIGGYAATFEAQDDNGTLVRRTVRARILVMTIPAHAVGTALNGVLPGTAALLAAADSGGGVPYPPVASFALAYPKSSFLDVDLPDGSGNLHDLPHTGHAVWLEPLPQAVTTSFRGQHCRRCGQGSPDDDADPTQGATPQGVGGEGVAECDTAVRIGTFRYDGRIEEDGGRECRGGTLGVWNT